MGQTRGRSRGARVTMSLSLSYRPLGPASSGFAMKVLVGEPISGSDSHGAESSAARPGKRTPRHPRLLAGTLVSYFHATKESRGQEGPSAGSHQDDPDKGHKGRENEEREVGNRSYRIARPQQMT